MADSTIPLNSGSGGKTLDTESLTGAGAATVERQRVELTGAALSEVARVQNSAPAGTEYALVTRPIAPATTVVSQPTAGNLNATVTGSVSVSNLPATQTVSGTVAISNLPATQPVSGSVSVSNFPATQTLAAAVAASSSPVGSISIGNSLGKVNVMKTGTLTTTATTADQVILTYTVTAGKTLYLQYLKWQARLTTYAATATLFGSISLESPAGTKLITEEIFHAGVDGCYTLQFSEPVPIAAGTVIRVVCTPSATTSFKWSASFGGYEK